MKKNYWYIYFFDKPITDDKKEIIKTMKFNTINEMSEVLGMKPYQSIPL